MRRIIVNTLKKLGHEDTVEAGDGKEALRALAAGVPDVIVALQAGVNDYLIKPFTPEALKEKINSLTRKP